MAVTPPDRATLAGIARQLRIEVLTMLHQAGSGHTGGSLSCLDILTALFFGHLRLDTAEACWPDRDRFVLSKGHAAPALYAVLARAGLLRPAELATLRRLGSSLQGHPDSKLCTGVECCTGSLGQGLGVAGGMALGLRLTGSPARVYALLGDGEMQEGLVWEAAMSAAHYGLANLTAIGDINGLQIDGPTAKVMNVEPLADKWQAFGWRVITCDGHDFDELLKALAQARDHEAGPSMILARTVKGKGVSIFENRAEYHGVVPSDAELRTALSELAAAGGEASRG